MNGEYNHDLWGKVIPYPKAEVKKPIPKTRKLNLIEGMFYEIELISSNSYDLINHQGKRSVKVKKKMKFICETQNLYILEHLNGLRECFSKYTPANELKIKPITRDYYTEHSKLNCLVESAI